MSRIAVTDTHALLWWSLGPLKKLGRQARNIFSLAESGQATIYIPVLAFVEIAEAMRRGAFPGAPAFSRWTAQVLASSNFLAADLTADVIVEADSLYSIPERGDRLIAATAVHLGYPLITRDPAFTRCTPDRLVTRLWGSSCSAALALTAEHLFAAPALHKARRPEGIRVGGWLAACCWG